jgi:hypothetical protein
VTDSSSGGSPGGSKIDSLMLHRQQLTVCLPFSHFTRQNPYDRGGSLRTCLSTTIVLDLAEVVNAQTPGPAAARDSRARPVAAR